jgi:hypothetical protein
VHTACFAPSQQAIFLLTVENRTRRLVVERIGLSFTFENNCSL